MDTISISAKLHVNSTTIGVSGLKPVIEGGIASLQEKTESYTPTETAQSETITPDSGFDGLSQVEISVGAISGDYVGSSVPRKSSSDLTASGATVTAPAGYYSSSASKSVASGSATTPATSITANPSISVSSGGLITATVNKSQNVTPTVSAGYVSSGTAGAIGVTGSSSSQLSTQAAATITPTESEQTAVVSGKYTTGAVKVGAISSTYVGSGITQRTSTDLSASGDTITAPAGYYASSASKSVAAGTAGTPSASKGTVSNHAVTVTPSVTNQTGYITGGTKTGTGVSVSAGELVSGTLDVSSSGTKDVTNYQYASIPALTLPSDASNSHSGSSLADIKPPANNASYLNIPTGFNNSAGYYTLLGAALTSKTITNNGTYYAEDDDQDGYSSVTVNVQGGSTPTLQEKTKSYTPTETAQSENVTADSGYDGLSKVSVSVGAISSSYVGSGITRRSSSDLTASGDTVSVPSGYYASNASKAVASGTVANPTATKGTVSNHSVSVTPSVQITNAGYVSTGTKTGTAVTVQASELVSGNLAITENGTGINVANFSTVSVAVEGGGGGLQVHTATATPASASQSISFTGLSGEPTSFYVISNSDLATGTPAKAAAVVFDGTNLIGQTITNTSNAQVSYDGSGWSKSYNSGTLTITGAAYFQAVEYTLVYTVGGTSANIGTADVQVGSGATSITFTGLPDDPTCWSLIFKNDFGTSSGYSRAISVINDGSAIAGLEMSSGASATQNWTASYSNGSLTITSSSTSAGGYFHQPGYYQLTYAVGGSIEIEIEQLTVTENGTYQESGRAYSPVIVNVSGGGGASVDTKTITNDTNTATSISFTSLKGTPVAFFVRCTTQMQSSSTTYYYVSNMRYNGTNVNGNAFRMGSTRQVTVVTSGYSYTYSSGTLTLTSSGSRTSSPGSFYNGNYELTYCY